MIVFAKRQILGLCGLMFISSLSTLYAIQPLSDSGLANTVGDQSPIQPQTSSTTNDVTTPPSTSTEQINTTIDAQQLPTIEQQITAITLSKVNSNSYYALDSIERQIQTKDDPTIPNLHQTAERNFGLEPFSMVWNGNLDARVDIDKINYVTFNSDSGQYEFDNVKGQVWIITTVD